MALRGTFLENGLDMYALQRITLVPSDDPSGDLYIDGSAYPPEGGEGAVDSVNGETGEVVLDADDIDDSATSHKYATAHSLRKWTTLALLRL